MGHGEGVESLEARGEIRAAAEDGVAMAQGGAHAADAALNVTRGK